MNTLASIILLALTTAPATPTTAAPKTVVVDLRIGHAIVNREVDDSEDTFFSAETVYAWTAVKGDVDRIEHVWLREGKVVARHSLAVGPRSFRTWTRHRVEPGNYTLEVRAADGHVLSTRSFQVFDSDDLNGC